MCYKQEFFNEEKQIHQYINIVYAQNLNYKVKLF
jgi:hypothetical protein